MQGQNGGCPLCYAVTCRFSRTQVKQLASPFSITARPTTACNCCAARRWRRLCHLLGGASAALFDAADKSMKTFKRESIRTHCVGTDWPDFLGNVDIGESFVIETEYFNMANGPIAINGVKAGESVAVNVEHVEILPPFCAPNGGPFFAGMGDSLSLEYAEGYFLFPKHFRLKARPSVGNIAVLPAPTARIREFGRARLRFSQRVLESGLSNGSRGRRA
jgi:hypothetical protein